jgi:hypothetical protein
LILIEFNEQSDVVAAANGQLQSTY